MLYSGGEKVKREHKGMIMNYMSTCSSERYHLNLHKEILSVLNVERQKETKLARKIRFQRIIHAKQTICTQI